jgi:hypothetical protein
MIETTRPWFILDGAVVLTERTVPIAAFCLDDDSAEANAVAITLNHILSTMGAPRLPVGNERNLSDRPLVRIRKGETASLDLIGKDVYLVICEGGAGAAVTLFTLGLRRTNNRLIFVAQ